jgi:hypothetical protein
MPAVCALHSLSRFIGMHAAHTDCKLLKKFKNTNLNSIDIVQCAIIFQRVEVPYTLR